MCDATVGRFLCRLRTEAGVSPQTLSRALGEDAGYVSRLEYAVRQVDVVEFIQIANTLRRPPERAMRNLMALDQKMPRCPVELPLLPTF